LGGNKKEKIHSEALLGKTSTQKSQGPTEPGKMKGKKMNVAGIWENEAVLNGTTVGEEGYRTE